MAPIETVRSFYDAFKAKDGDRMASFYSEKVVFSDPVFPALTGDEAKAMWRMLCGRAKDLKVEYEIVTSTGNQVTVKWDAFYTFGATGRSVHNQVVSELFVEDGKICKQTDRFDFWKWSSQALGPVGLLFGWSPFLKQKVQSQAAESLKSFSNFNPSRTGA